MRGGSECESYIITVNIVEQGSARREFMQEKSLRKQYLNAPSFWQHSTNERQRVREGSGVDTRDELSVNKLGERQGWMASVEQPVCGGLLRNLHHARVNTCDQEEEHAAVLAETRLSFGHWGRHSSYRSRCAQQC